MKIQLVVTLFCSVILSAKAQELNRADLTKKLDIGSEAVFVLNGIAYARADSTKLTEALKKIRPELVVDMSVMKKSDAHITTKDVVIITFAESLSPKLVDDRYQEIEGSFKDAYAGYSQDIFHDAKDPVLYIDGEKIHHTETSSRFKKLKKSDIAFIYSKLDRQSDEIYGKNAKNGVVIIWTKKRITQD